MNSEKNATTSSATTPSKIGGEAISAERALAARLKELGINPSGLPRHVTAQLRAVVDAETVRFLDALAAKIAALEAKTGKRLRAQIARVVTLKTVGKAFALPTVKTGGTTP